MSYDNNRFIYFCGNKLYDITEKKASHTLFLFDLKELTVAEIFEDHSFIVLCRKNSAIGSKHRQGGQSSQRFERERRNQMLRWFKRLNDVLTNINSNVVVGSHEFYKKMFYEQLTTENKKKIQSFFNSEYCDESGIYQYISIIQHT